MKSIGCEKLVCAQVPKASDNDDEVFLPAKSPEAKLQFRVIYRKMQNYHQYLTEMRSSMITVDRFLELAENNRTRDVERAMANLARALELQTNVASSQAGILLSVTSDMCLIPDHIKEEEGNALRDELRKVTSHSVRCYVEIDPKDTEEAKVNQAFEIVTSNGSRVYLATYMLDRLVTKIVNTMRNYEPANVDESAAN